MEIKFSRLTAVAVLFAMGALASAQNPAAPTKQPGAQPPGQPGVPQPGANQPVPTQPVPTQPGVPPRGTVQPGAVQPGAVQPGIGQRVTGQPGMGQPDAILANWLIVDNEGEVAVSKFAQERAAHKDVKEFAKQMAEEHQQMIGELARFAGRQVGREGEQGRDGANRRDETRRTEPARTPEREQGAAGQNPTNPRPEQLNQPGQLGQAQREIQRDSPTASARPAAGRMDFISLKRELGQKCLATVRKELDSKTGAEFDQCYMYQQVAMHLHAIDTMEVFKNHASPEFAQALTKGIETAEEHLEHARKIVKSLDDDAVATTARREKSDK